MGQTQEVYYKTPFEQFGEYVLDFSKRARETHSRIMSNSNWYNTQNIDDRVNNFKFFYFPKEEPMDTLNCFESNMHMYLALGHIYPESNPLLINLLVDDVNLHSSVLFTHQDEVYFVDPIRMTMGQARLESNKIIVEKNLLSSKQEGDEIKFTEIHKISNNKLEEILKILRSEEGIVDYFYGSGQMASSALDWPYMKRLFMHIDENYVVHGQIRTEDYVPGVNDNSLIKIEFNPFNEEFTFSNFLYSRSFWQNTYDTKLLTHCEEFSDRHHHAKVSFDVCEYLERTQMAFSSDSKLHKKIKKIKKLPKDFEHLRNLNSDFQDYYLDYALEKDGENFGIDLDEKLDKKLNENNEDLELQEKINFFGEIAEKGYTEIDNRNRFQLFGLAYDFKRYAYLIKENI